MNNSLIRNIEGKNILLVPFTEKYVTADYLRWMNDAETTRFILKAQGDITRDDLLSFAKTMNDSKHDYFFAVLLKDSLRHIGNVRLGPIDFNLKLSKFGIMIGEKDIRGCSLGTETVELIKSFCFDELNLDRLHFPVVKEYEPAMRLYKKTGFTCLGEMETTFEKNGQSFTLVEWSMDNPKNTRV